MGGTQEWIKWILHLLLALENRCQTVHLPRQNILGLFYPLFSLCQNPSCPMHGSDCLDLVHYDLNQNSGL